MVISNDTISELTTTLLEPLLPGLTEKYGKGIGMKMDVRTKTYPTTIFKTDEIGMDISVDVDF